MEKKELIKPDYIINDIVASIKSGHKMSKKEHIIFSIVFLLFATILIFCFDFLALPISLIILWAMGHFLILPFIVHIKTQSINLNNYEIKTLVLSNKKTEEYNITHRRWRFFWTRVLFGRRLSYRTNVIVRTMYFEKNLEWQIPDGLYQWCSNGAFSTATIFDNATVGDKFFAVIDKKTGKIAVAYDTKIFEYDKKRQWETSL